MVRLGRILACVAVISLVIPCACAPEQYPQIEDPKDRFIEILHPTDEQIEQLETGTGTLTLREDQADILSDYVTQLLEDLQPWLDEARWQEVKGILEAMLAQGEVDLQTLDPVTEAIHDSLISEAEGGTGVYTNLVRLPAESTATMKEQSQLSDGSQLPTVVTVYTPIDNSDGDKDYHWLAFELEKVRGKYSDSISSADPHSGATGVYSFGSLFAGAHTYALQRILINVPVDGADITITSRLMYTSGTFTLFPPMLDGAQTNIYTRHPHKLDQQPDSSSQVIDPLFEWVHAVEWALMIVSCGTSSVVNSLAHAASVLLTLDDALAYERALEEDGEEEVVTYSADSLAAGDYYFEIGFYARVASVVGSAYAFVFGMVPEIEVTLTFGEEEAVTFPDPNLEAEIREAIGKPEGPIYPSDLEGLTGLHAGGRDITNLTGLEHCTKLIVLYLDGNQISDISPLANLTSLIYLRLDSNQISDISPLANLTSLEALVLHNNQISDISHLANLTNLGYLGLSSNQISYISPLANLTNLMNLDLSNNQINDISPLANLTSLRYLHLNSNQISDISPLVDNPGLGEGDIVWLSNNPLSDDSINIYIPQLEVRGVSVL